MLNLENLSLAKDLRKVSSVSDDLKEGFSSLTSLIKRPWLWVCTNFLYLELGSYADKSALMEDWDSSSSIFSRSFWIETFCCNESLFCKMEETLASEPTKSLLSKAGFGVLLMNSD